MEFIKCDAQQICLICFLAGYLKELSLWWLHAITWSGIRTDAHTMQSVFLFVQLAPGYPRHHINSMNPVAWRPVGCALMPALLRPFTRSLKKAKKLSTLKKSNSAHCFSKMSPICGADTLFTTRYGRCQYNFIHFKPRDFQRLRWIKHIVASC